MSEDFNLEKMRIDLRKACEELFDEAIYTRPGDVFVLGGSSSEMAGGSIGKNSTPELGRLAVETVLDVCREHEVYLAVQGCEHINRALVLEREALENYGFEEVNVLPQLHAGGAFSVAAWELFEDPCMAEFIEATLGLDIGDTEIGMHVRHVQRPVRLSLKTIGQAHLTALMYRPKLIGGERACYQKAPL